MGTRAMVLLAVATLLGVLSCVSDEDRNHVKALVVERYPEFERDVQKVITTRHGAKLFADQRWEWHIEPGAKRNKWKVQYGCFRVLSTSEVLLGEVVADLSGEVSGGLISYNPKAEGKGVYVELIVDSKSRTITHR